MHFQRRKHRCKLWMFVLTLSVFMYLKASILYIDIVNDTSINKTLIDGYVIGNTWTTGPGNVTQEAVTSLPTLCSVDLLGRPEALQVQDCVKSATCAKMTCRNLLFGNNSKKSTDRTMYAFIRTFMKEHPKQLYPDSHYIKLTKNCNTFKSSQGYALSPLNSEEATFPIAFNILVHRDVEHVERLLRAIYRPQNFYCIHIDTKAKESLHQAIRSIAQCFDNVFVSSKSEWVVYAGISRLKADIHCMRDHLTNSDKWKYLINVAGQSFPVKTNHEIVQILKVYNGSNDIEGFQGRGSLKTRYVNEFVEINRTRMHKTGRKNPPPPHDLDIVKGSAYGVFSRKFVDFIINDPKSKDLLEWSHYTYSPDEHYWATLHHTYSNPHIHPPGGYSGRPQDKPWMAVYANWGSKCFGKIRHTACVFGVADLPDLVSRKELFINKFDLDFEPLGLDCLESWFKHKTYCPSDFDLEFYKNLPFVKSGRAKSFTR